MSIFEHIPVTELSTLLQVVQQSFHVRRHYELFNWLQDELQRFLPHDILLAVWGDIELDLYSYDVVSPLPGIRTSAFNDQAIHSFVNALFQRWQECDGMPYTINAEQGFLAEELSNPSIREAMQNMRCALVHGIRDQRGRHNCLYILLGPSQLGNARSRGALRFLLPYIDTTFRQIAHLPEQYIDPVPPPAPPVTMPERAEERLGLSEREIEIMNWVRRGKTNHEIGMILDISAFTVKNHLQRIFKKLDVLNRAQAVARMESTQ